MAHISLYGLSNAIAEAVLPYIAYEHLALISFQHEEIYISSLYRSVHNALDHAFHLPSPLEPPALCSPPFVTPDVKSNNMHAWNYYENHIPTR